jgi:hypothetical protein
MTHGAPEVEGDGRPRAIGRSLLQKSEFCLHFPGRYESLRWQLPDSKAVCDQPGG